MVEQPSIDALQEPLDTFLEHAQHETGIPGIGAAISVAGSRVHSGVGVLADGDSRPIAADTQFHLGCITKLLVSVVVLELARAGRLDLSLPIGRYLPELEHTVHGRTVHVAHLLSHTSGYRGTNIHEKATLALDWARFVGYLHAAPQDFAPGTVFSYEHTEAVLAGEIIRRVTGMSSLAHVRERIFEPLGITPGVLDPQRPDRARQAGQHILDPAARRFKRIRWADLLGDARTEFSSFWASSFSTMCVSLADLLTIAEYITGAATNVPSDLPAAAFDQLLEPAIGLPATVGGPLAELAPVTFGLGAACWRDAFHGVGGATYGQCQGFRFEPRLGAAVAVGVNALQPYVRDLVIARICASLKGRRPEPPGQAVAEFPLHEAAGVYVGAGRNRVTAEIEQDKLVLVLESGAAGAGLRAELAVDSMGALVLRSRAPHLRVGLFREAGNGNVGLMVGNNAYKRISPSAR